MAQIATCLLQLLPPPSGLCYNYYLYLSALLLGTTNVNMHVQLSPLTSTCVSASFLCCHLLHKPVVSLSWSVSWSLKLALFFLHTPVSQATTAVTIHLCACVRDTSLDVWVMRHLHLLVCEFAYLSVCELVQWLWLPV